VADSVIVLSIQELESAGIWNPIIVPTKVPTL